MFYIRTLSEHGPVMVLL